MPLKDILVCLEDPKFSLDAAIYAAALARKHESHLIGLYAYDLFEAAVLASAGEASARHVQRIIAEREAMAIATGTELRAAFDELARRHEVASEWRQLDGTVPAVATQHARYADLAIVGRSEDAFSRARAIAEAVLFDSGRPVLVVPPSWRAANPPMRVLVGWNGSREAARAVHDALPLLSAARKVQLLSIRGEEYAEAGRAEVQDVARHLARHGVQVHAELAVSAGSSAEDVLQNELSGGDYDLLVIGGYGHSRFREIVLGGMTRRVLQHGTVPVLLSH